MFSVSPDNGLTQSAYGLPIIGGGLYDYNTAPLRVNGFADPVDPPVVYNREGVTYFRGDPLTDENLEAAVAARAAQRTRELGRPLSRGEIDAIRDAYKQLVGRRPAFYNVDGDGAAVPRTKGFWSIFSSTITGSAKQVGSGLQTVGETVTNPIAISGVGLIAVAIAAVVLFRK